MLYRHGVVVALPTGGLREQAIQALDRVAQTRPDVSPRVLAWITDAREPVDAEGAPVIRVWRGGRAAGGDNPFAHSHTRHAIGLEPNLDVEHLARVLSHLATGTPMRLEDLAAGPPAERWCLEHTTQLDQVRASVGSALAQGGVRESDVEEMLTLFDEMLSNALYDAPVHEGEHVYRRVSRKLQVPVVQPTDVAVSVGPHRAGISVRDRFGSLSPDAVLINLERCYRRGPEQIDKKWGGAGLGFYMLLAGSARLVIHVEPQRSTEVIIVREHTARRAAQQAATPSFSFCQGTAGATHAR